MNDMEKKYLQLIRFVVISNELQNPKYGRSNSEAERPIKVPSTKILWKDTIAVAKTSDSW